jgi:uncharacterized protein YndB with AHSA1/START domain
METKKQSFLKVETSVKAPVEKVWKHWNDPVHIKAWCHATDDWHVPFAENDLRLNGKFKTTMAAKDGSMAFDFEGVYNDIIENKSIGYVMGDGRKVKVSFSGEGPNTKVTEEFEPENINPEEMQQAGWQSILDNFKKYTETF